MNEEKEKKVYDFIKGNLINGVVILTSLIYIFYGMVSIERTNLNIWQCLAAASIGIIVGFMIKQGLGENGFNKGYASNIWKNSLEKYSNACNEANPYIEKVDNFYYCEEIEKKRNYRRSYLMGNQMRYEWFFDNKGNYVENPERFEKLTKKQKKILNKCVKVKIYNLNLFSEYSLEVESLTHKEITDKDQRLKMVGKNSLAQILSAIIGVYFVAYWNNWNWGVFIATSVQVAIWVSCGIIQLYINYNYVVIEKVNKLTRKKELLIKFKSGCEKGLYNTNPYEEEVKNEVLAKTDNISAIQFSNSDIVYRD